MGWTDEMIEAEAVRQEQVAEEKTELDTIASQYYPESRGWTFVEYTPGGHDYAWVHSCGREYYQLDCPSVCYQACEEE